MRPRSRSRGFSGHGGAFGTGLWVRADSNWYTSVARHGYSIDPQAHAAFFPLYPTLIAGLGCLLGDYNLAGLLISLASCAVAFELLWRLAAPRVGSDGATRAVLYLALFPMAVFLGSGSRRIAVPRAGPGRVPARRA